MAATEMEARVEDWKSEINNQVREAELTLKNVICGMQEPDRVELW